MPGMAPACEGAQRDAGLEQTAAARAAHQLPETAQQQRTSAMPSSMRMTRKAASELMAPKQLAMMPACKQVGSPSDRAQ